MGTESSGRARMRDDLRELAKLASPDPASSTPHRFETADSSGFVDLSAFSASDDSWVDRELSRASGRASARDTGGAVLTAGSMAPVAMAALLNADPGSTQQTTRKKSKLVAALGLAAGVAVVALLAVAVTRNAPSTLGGSAPAAAAVVAVTPTTAATMPAAPSTASVETSSSVAASPAVPLARPPAEPQATAHDPALRSKKLRGHASYAAPAAHPIVAARATAAPAAVPPARKPGSGGDSLMDMMRASVGTPKK